VDLLHRAQELAMATLLGDTNLVNTELESLGQVTTQEVRSAAQQLLKADNCSSIYYQSKA
ncbi:MAG: insulinase family protein, partial [Bacteroidota bacterium]